MSADDLRNQLKSKVEASGLKFYPFTLKNNKTKIVVYWSERFFVVVDVNNVKMPFYLSSGFGGKTNVPPGKWYPYFGVGPDGWLNKTTTDQILNYYHSNKLKSVAHKLDDVLGDLRPHKDLFPLVGYTTVAPNSNQDMQPVEADEGAQENVNNVLKRIGDVHFTNASQVLVQPLLDKLITDYSARKLSYKDLFNQVQQLISQHPNKKEKIIAYYNKHPVIQDATR